jgi:hypothetical protein
VEPTNFATVWNLVSSSRRAQQEAKDIAAQDERDSEHAKIMEEKRRKDLEFRDQLRKMGQAGYRGKDFAQKKTILVTSIMLIDIHDFNIFHMIL